MQHGGLQNQNLTASCAFSHKKSHFECHKTHTLSLRRLWKGGDLGGEAPIGRPLSLRKPRGGFPHLAHGIKIRAPKGNQFIWYRPRPLRCRGLGVRGILRAEKKHLQTGFRQGGWSNCIPMGLETTKNKNYEPQNRCVFLVQSQRFSVRRALKFRSSQCSFDETMPQQHPK